MTVKLISAQVSGRGIVENLFRYYLYDMAVFMGWRVNKNGEYDVNLSLLDEYWSEPDNHPYLIQYQGEIAGFSLLRRYPDEESNYDIGQFFVLRKFEGKGVGREAFKQSVALYPGPWLTRVLHENKSALGFWLKVIAELTDGDFQHQTEVDVDLPMHFIRYQSVAAET
ncbi:acetyltransferase (GNAT) family protein [Sinobacterium caligoides]|uniref:Acetyltransferase (GNAT) family protein n=1 Tax=Sinobacterium caligoides TaxID=933926 RepID=A0A3N2DZA3_9GAMM|nr:GNAT family N-acetyltransferase [Sinobacterium caligoides]ROS04982.1 acetyltransferase (GNAT) family protein [Sinobacterium caligoides]